MIFRICHISCLCLMFLIRGISSSDSVLGCGGFLTTSSASIDHVKVQLTTPDGIVKYETDAAPHNGYYFLPVYRKGAYIVKVVSTPGWSFSPAQYSVSVDGETDMCSRGDDLNFVFNGFSVFGQVCTLGSESGPAGVTVTLSAPDGGGAQQTALTEEGGDFVFNSVSPGRYKVVASHASWRVMPNTVSITVSDANAHVPKSLTISGFELSGMVRDLNGVPLPGALVTLHSEHDVSHCTSDAKFPDAAAAGGSSGYDAGLSLPPIRCAVYSQSDGMYRFSAVPNGRYHVAAHHRTDTTTFQWKPSYLTLVVNNNSSISGQALQVSGFSVSGRLLLSASAGVAQRPLVFDQVTVVLKETNGAFLQQSSVDNSGRFKFDNVPKSTFLVNVVADWVRFSEVSLPLSPESAVIPDLVVSDVRVCGSIDLNQLPDGVVPDSRRVEFSTNGFVDRVGVDTDQKGSFCVFLPEGVYESRVVVSEHEVKLGLHFGSSVAKLTVSGVNRETSVHFSALGGRVQGRVVCVAGPCPVPLTVLLQGEHSLPSLTKNVLSSDAQFVFENVLPGQYRASVTNKEQWCWQNDSVPVTVSVHHDPVIDIVQSGWLVVIESSHSTDLQYRVDSPSPQSSSTSSSSSPPSTSSSSSPSTTSSSLSSSSGELLSLQAGANSVCVPVDGSYVLTTLSPCHVFTESPYRASLPADSPLKLVASTHRVTAAVRVQSDRLPIEQLKLSATDSEGRQLEPSCVGKLHCSWFVAAGKLVTVRALSDQLVFSPSADISHLTSDRCSDTADVEFSASRGVFVSGSVTPAIAGVEISVSSAPQQQAVHTKTDRLGKYSVGPLSPGVNYDVSAELEGYHFTDVPVKADEDAYAITRDFHALRLSRLQVNCVSSGDDRHAKTGGEVPLSGVLVSMSGDAGFRDNRLTGAEGRVVYTSLNAGQLFIRPLLKEYQFDPPSSLFNVTEGELNQLTFRGRRVAFSMEVRVMAISGRVEADVLIQASGTGGCSDHVEHAVSSADGVALLQALRPACEYAISVKESGETFSDTADQSQQRTITRAVPTTRTIKMPAEGGDVRDVVVSVLRHLPEVAVSGYVSCPGTCLSTGWWVTLSESADSTGVLLKSPLSAAVFSFSAVLTPSTRPHVLRLQAGPDSSALVLDTVTFTPSVEGHFFQLAPRSKSAGSEKRSDSGPRGAPGVRGSSSTVGVVLLLVVLAALLFWPQVRQIWRQASTDYLSMTASKISPRHTAASKLKSKKIQ